MSCHFFDHSHLVICVCYFQLCHLCVTVFVVCLFGISSLCIFEGANPKNSELGSRLYGLISPDDPENAINFFRRPRERKIYQQTTPRISTNDIAVFLTVTLQNLYHSNINSLLFRQPNITSQPYIFIATATAATKLFQTTERRKTSRNRSVCLTRIDSNRSFPMTSSQL